MHTPRRKLAAGARICRFAQPYDICQRRVAAATHKHADFSSAGTSCCESCLTSSRRVVRIDVIDVHRRRRSPKTGRPENWGRNSPRRRRCAARVEFVEPCTLRGEGLDHAVPRRRHTSRDSRSMTTDHRRAAQRLARAPRSRPSPTAPSCDYLRVRRPATRPRRGGGVFSKPLTKTLEVRGRLAGPMHLCV